MYILELHSRCLEYNDGLCCKLVTACPKVRPVVAFRELEVNRAGIKLTKKLGAGHFGEVWMGRCPTRNYSLFIHARVCMGSYALSIFADVYGELSSI